MYWHLHGSVYYMTAYSLTQLILSSADVPVSYNTDNKLVDAFPLRYGLDFMLLRRTSLCQRGSPRRRFGICGRQKRFAVGFLWVLRFHPRTLDPWRWDRYVVPKRRYSVYAAYYPRRAQISVFRRAVDIQSHCLNRWLRRREATIWTLLTLHTDIYFYRGWHSLFLCHGCLRTPNWWRQYLWWPDWTSRFV
jgi:hypothetical protein